MWLRNNVSTILCNGTENFLFYTIAFLGVFGWSDIVSMSLTATAIEVIIALCDTPFLYLAKKVKNGDVYWQEEKESMKSGSLMRGY